MKYKKILAILLAISCVSFTACAGGSGSASSSGNSATTSSNSSSSSSSSSSSNSSKDASSSEKTEGTKEVHFAMWWGESEISYATKWLEKNFTPKSGIKVVFDYTPYDGVVQQMISKIAAGNPPDLILAEEPMASAYYNGGLMLPVDDLCERDNVNIRKEYFSADNYVYDGKLYGLPVWYGASYMFANVDMIEAAGFKVPRGHWTWDEMHKIAKACTNSEKNIYGLVQNLSGNISHAWYYTNGGHWFNSDYTACTINSKNMINALEYNRKMIWEDKISPEPSIYSTTAPDQMFRDGQAAFMLNGTWDVNYLRVNADKVKFDWDVIYMPNGPDSNGKETSSWTNVLFIPKNVKDVDAAWEVMKCWATVDGMNAMSIGALSAMPPSQATIDAEAYYTYPNQKPKSFNKEFITELSKVAVPENFSHVYFNENVTNAANSLMNVLIENRDAKTVCDEAYNKIMDNWDQLVFISK